MNKFCDVIQFYLFYIRVYQVFKNKKILSKIFSSRKQQKFNF